MNHIGNIIKYFREINDLTRIDLSKNICTEKYLYMIERGDRNPSVDVVRKIGNRVGVDLFKYFGYLDCKDPISVYNLISKIDYLRIENNIIELKKTTELANKMSDFTKSPWKYELQINSILYKIFIEENYDTSLVEIDHTLKFLEQHYHDKVFIVHFSLLAALVYHLQGTHDKALLTLLNTKPLLDNIDCITHARLYVFFTIILYIAYFNMKNYSSSMKIINELIEYQSKNGLYERIYFSYFYLSFCYYKLNNMDKCITTFIDALSLISIFDRPIDVKFIVRNPLFNILLNNEKVPSQLSNKIRSMYF